jgi:hypothetical protein
MPLVVSVAGRLIGCWSKPAKHGGDLAPAVDPAQLDPSWSRSIVLVVRNAFHCARGSGRT